MNVSNIEISENAAKNYTKSYGTRAALDKGTAKMDEMLRLSNDSGTVRRVIVAVPEGEKAGRFTALYILQGAAVSWVRFIADSGFQVIG